MLSSVLTAAVTCAYYTAAVRTLFEADRVGAWHSSRELVCMSVCPLAYIDNRTSKFHPCFYRATLC